MNAWMASSESGGARGALRRSRSRASGAVTAGIERSGVPDARELAEGVVVRLHGTGRRVGDGEVVLDAGEGAEEDPELLVDRAGVEDLDDELDVGLGEEPEVARVGGDGSWPGRRRCGPGSPARRPRPRSGSRSGRGWSATGCRGRPTGPPTGARTPQRERGLGAWCLPSEQHAQGTCAGGISPGRVKKARRERGAVGLGGSPVRPRPGRRAAKRMQRYSRLERLDLEHRHLPARVVRERAVVAAPAASGDALVGELLDPVGEGRGQRTSPNWPVHGGGV